MFDPHLPPADEATPEFVMVGYLLPDGRRAVLFSTSITNKAKVSTTWRQDDPYDHGNGLIEYFPAVAEKYYVVIDMSTYFVAVGEDHNQIMRDMIQYEDQTGVDLSKLPWIANA